LEPSVGAAVGASVGVGSPPPSVVGLPPWLEEPSVGAVVRASCGVGSPPPSVVGLPPWLEEPSVGAFVGASPGGDGPPAAVGVSAVGVFADGWLTEGFSAVGVFADGWLTEGFSAVGVFADGWFTEGFSAVGVPPLLLGGLAGFPSDVGGRAGRLVGLAEGSDVGEMSTTRGTAGTALANAEPPFFANVDVNVPDCTAAEIALVMDVVSIVLTTTTS
jgi:hypothetical protein